MGIGSESPRPPILFFKVGMPESAPDRWGAAFAAKFGAVLLTRSGISRRIAQGRPPGYNRRITQGIIMERFIGEATTILIDGSDVITEIGFNTQKSREKTPLRVARLAGCWAIALDMYSPEALMQTRLDSANDRRIARGSELKARSIDWRGYHSIVRPNVGEQGLHRIFRLDGGNDVIPLMNQIYLKLAEADLLNHDYVARKL